MNIIDTDTINALHTIASELDDKSGQEIAKGERAEGCVDREAARDMRALTRALVGGKFPKARSFLIQLDTDTRFLVPDEIERALRLEVI